MASAVLAATHFNERNPSVVPELEDPSFKECNFEFDLNNLIFFDSDLVEHKALVQLQDYILNNGPPCAVAGPYDDDQVMEVSVLASSVQVPLVNHHGFDLELSFDWSHPFLTQSNPFPFDYIQSIYSYVMDKGRTNFIAILSSRQPSSQHLGEGLATFLQTMGVSTRIFPYAESLDQVVRLFDEELASLEGAMTKIKDTGFRTIIVIPESFDIMDKFVTMGKEAESLKINTGEYFWLFITELPLEVINENMTANENVTKLLAGAALFHAVEGFSVDEDKDRFLQSWRNQNTSAVELLKKLNPIPKGMPGYYEPSDDYFSTVDPETGAAFLYDAVMSIGFGACLAGPKGGINGSSHVRGIQSSEFAGASGRVLYGGGSVLKGNGVRNTYSAMYGVYNLLPPGGNVTWVLTDLLDPSNSSVTARNSGATKGWISLKEFVFADGRSVGPDLLVLAGQNYLSPGVRAIGFALFSIAVASGIASIFWIIIYRKHQVLRAAQPSFLLIVCTGAMIMSYTILSISFEENNGLTEDQLSKLCVSGPWALILGHILIYSALFAKVRVTILCAFLF